MIQTKLFQDGGEIVEATQTNYFPASDSCETLNTLVPISMAKEQARFNKRMKADVVDVVEYVRQNLMYNSKEDVCRAFKAEQIDAIATAIYNYEKNGDAIIIADQTGVGKGRMAAGLLRYASLKLGKVPIFLTEKKHLFSDIYRDIVDIGWDVGVHEEVIQTTTKKDDEYKDEQILDIIKRDIKDNDEIIVDVDLSGITNDDGEINWKALFNEENEDLLATIIDAYREELATNGEVITKYVKVPHEIYRKNVEEKLKQGRHVVRPLMLPDNVKIRVSLKIDDDFVDGILYSKDKKEVDRILNNHYSEIESEYRIILSTYSQFGRIYKDKNKTELSDKVKFIQTISDKNILILDESHNAAGISPDGVRSNTGSVLFNCIKKAKFVTYISATYAKRPTNIPLYAIKTAIRESQLSDIALIRTFQAGKIALQEAISSELVKEGQLVRREKKINGKTEMIYEVETTETGQDQILKMASVADIRGRVGEVEEYISSYIKALKKENKELYEPFKYGGRTKRFDFLLFSFMLIGMKCEQVAKRALEKLKNGRKTIIAIANTLESSLDNIKRDYTQINGGGNYEIGDTIPNDFIGYMLYLLRYTYRMNYEITKIEDDGTITNESFSFNILDVINQVIENPTSHGYNTDIVDFCQVVYNKTFQKYLEQVRIISNLHTNVYLSPIDVIKNIIKREGYTIEELTGRGRELEFSQNNDFIDFSKGTIIRRKKIDKKDAINKFQENDIDCLIINQSAATGVSMHAIPAGKAKIVSNVKDEKGNLIPPSKFQGKEYVYARAMLLMQMELDITKEVQKLGRIDRTGQIYNPEYEYLISVIPSESRLTSLMEQKLRSLSANVSSSQTQSSHLFSADDFFGENGIEAFNTLMKELRIPYTATTSENVRDYTKTMYFKSFGVQRDFYRRFSEILDEIIKKQKDNGVYVGQISIKEYKAQPIVKSVFMIGDTKARTVFGSHSSIELSECTDYKKKFTESYVYNEINSNLWILSENKTDIQVDYEAYKKYVLEGIERYRKSFIQLRRDSIVETQKENETKLASIEALKKRSEEFESVAFAVELFEKINKGEETIKNLQIEVGRIALTGNMQDVQKVMEQINKEQLELNKNKDLFVPLKEIYEKKDEHKAIIRAIEVEEKAIEKNIDRINDFNDRINETNVFMDLLISYVSNIGNIFNYKYFTESYDFDSPITDENGEFIGDKIIMKEVTNENCVLVGVSIPSKFYINDYITMSDIKLKFIAVAGRNEISLSSVHKTLHKNFVIRGGTHSDFLIDSGINYRNTWDKDHVRNVDTSFKTEKCIISGSILRAYHVANIMQLSSDIIKYDTAKGQTKIGIQLSDVSEKYYANILTTGGNYVVFFVATSENIQRLMLDYISTATYKQYLYSANRGWIEIVDGKINLTTYSVEIMNAYLMASKITGTLDGRGISYNSRGGLPKQYDNQYNKFNYRILLQNSVSLSSVFCTQKQFQDEIHNRRYIDVPFAITGYSYDEFLTLIAFLEKTNSLFISTTSKYIVDEHKDVYNLDNIDAEMPSDIEEIIIDEQPIIVDSNEQVWFTDEALKFIPKSQLKVISANKKEFKDSIIRLNDIIANMPKTYETEGQENKTAYLHYFDRGYYNWFIIEKDQEKDQVQAYGLIDMHEQEYGYINIEELVSHGEIELDLYFIPKLINDVADKKEEQNKSLVEYVSDIVSLAVEIGGISKEQAESKIDENKSLVEELYNNEIDFTLAYHKIFEEEPNVTVPISDVIEEKEEKPIDEEELSGVVLEFTDEENTILELYLINMSDLKDLFDSGISDEDMINAYNYYVDSINEIYEKYGKEKLNSYDK